jgi:hypothetical protein
MWYHRGRSVLSVQLQAEPPHQGNANMRRLNFDLMWIRIQLFSFHSNPDPDPASSVADPGFLSLIPDPDFYPSRIPDPKTATKERGEKKFDVIPFYVATNFTKLYIILVLKKKIWANFQRIIELLPKKLSLSSQKYGFGIPDPGVKKAPDPGSGSATLPASKNNAVPDPG